MYVGVQASTLATPFLFLYGTGPHLTDPSVAANFIHGVHAYT